MMIQLAETLDKNPRIRTVYIKRAMLFEGPQGSVCRWYELCAKVWSPDVGEWIAITQRYSDNLIEQTDMIVEEVLSAEESATKVWLAAKGTPND